MKKRIMKSKITALALCLMMFAGIVFPNGMQRANAAAVPFTGQNGVVIANAAMTVVADGRIGMTLVFSGINDAAVQRGKAVVDGNSYTFTKVASGIYSITYYLEAKEITGTRTISVQDGNTLVPLQNKNVPVIEGKAVINGSDFIDSAVEIDKASGGEYTAIYQAVASYGACAKSFFDNDPKESPVSAQNVDFTAYEPALSGNLPNGITYCGSSLILEDSITLRHYFSADYTKVTDPTKYVVKVDGKTANIGYNETNDLYYVDITGVVAWDIDHTYALTIAGDSKNFTLKYSALSYAYLCTQRNTDAKLTSLVKSIYWFNKAIKDYLDVHSDPETTPTPYVTPDPEVTPDPSVTPAVPLPSITLEEMEAITPIPKTPLPESGKYDGYTTYEEHGAKGDGKTNDYAAIVETHRYANEHNLMVKATPGHTYYVSKMDVNNPNGALIKTDTDWTGAYFIIDDSHLTANDDEHECWLFTVASDYEMTYQYAHKGVSVLGKFISLLAGQSKVNATFDMDGLLYIKDDNEKKFTRTGTSPDNSHDGYDHQEALILHKDGTIDSRTPVSWDFKTITTVYYYPIDPDLLTIKGGVFTTKANWMNTNSHYVYRAIQITRSNVLCEGIDHIVDERENEEGFDRDYISPYHGFFHIEHSAYVTIKDCKLSSHYRATIAGETVAPYDLYYATSCCVYLENVTEYTSVLDGSLWGIMGTNYCKDLRADNCKLTRFDVHAGSTGCVVTNSEFGVGGINLIGDGLAYFEGVTCHGQSFISLRKDYGSSWDGDMIIKNCVWHPTYQSSAEEHWGNIIGNYVAEIIFIENPGVTWYGYQCCLPSNIFVDGFKVEQIYPLSNDGWNYYRNNGVYLFSKLYALSDLPNNSKEASEIYRADSLTKPNYLQPPQNVYIRNFSAENKVNVHLNRPFNDFFYENTYYDYE